MTLEGRLADRLQRVLGRIAEAERAAARAPGEVKLVCVSKRQPIEAIREAYALGQRRFGENYAQELGEKAEALADLTDLEWHFIGHLQSNKAKVVARWASVVHAIDAASVARELGRRRLALGLPPLAVLLEVNLGGEAQKHGMSAAELPEIAARVAAEPALALRGLMTVPPAGDREAARRVFSTLRTLRNVAAPSLPELSMGMSDDLDVAIAEGATYVRVGTAIFGERRA
ncbi:MAG: YggS family pyridoxal phosphate-dependent enzyme [Myxococcales bacterium]|nr:YggS family pyridoxal phosphate-dependent enzyme [Myxococcales bacterium]